MKKFLRLLSDPAKIWFHLVAKHCIRRSFGAFYRVPCDNRGLNYDKYFSTGDAERNPLTEFNSNNTELLNIEQTKEKIASLTYIQERLAEDN